MDRIDEQIAFFQSTWINPPGTTLQVYFPVALGRNIGNSDAAATHALAMADSDIQDRRTEQNADLILLYVGQDFTGTDCGYSAVPTNGWQLPIDQRYVNASHLSVVTAHTSCDGEKLAAHELAHNFGAGHEISGRHLFSYSYAMAGAPFDIHASIVASAFCFQLPNCTEVPVYSDPDIYGDATHDNARTIETTALSIASYRPLPGGLQKPKNLAGSVFQQCTYDRFTQHLVTWDEGGSTYPIGVIEFQIHAAQPPTDPFIYRWSEIGQLHTFADVYGAPAVVRVKACFGGSCTELSDTGYYAQWICSPY